MIDAENVLVSVLIVSYNQEDFIEKTIKSILAQETDFSIEIIITDDASTDSTSSIIENFQKQHPKLIRVLSSTENLGPYKNGLRGYQAARGKYITWIDGDDAWDHPKKLQAQIDFLEANPDFTGCFHDARIIHEAGTEESNNRAQGDFKLYSQFNEYREEFHPWHLLKRNIIPTASLVFRNNVDLQNLPVMNSKGLSLNWLMQLEIIKGGKFKYFNEPWSIYNDHPLGVSKKNKLNDFKRANIEILNALLEDDYYGNLKRDLYESMAHEYLQLMLSPESQDLPKAEFEALTENYLESCNNLALQLTDSHGD
ncbi:MAG: glycosyltransferase [Flavobacteriales bacterium]|nr:glycosyltransferase [Flavobacteriales bacterium]